MRALVTGANGFVGSALCRFLVEQRIEVRALVRKNSNRSLLEGLPIEIFHGDVAGGEPLSGAVQGCDLVFHVAGAVLPTRQSDFEKVNVAGTQNILKACQAESRLKRFIFVSSLAAVGPSINGSPIDETMPARPVSAYGESKLKAESLVLASQIPATIIRPPAIFGPGDKATLPLFLWASRGWALRLGGVPLSISVVYVEDLARAMATVALDERGRGKTYFVSYPEMFDPCAMMAQIAELFGRRARTITVPSWLLRPAAAIVESVCWALGRRPQLTRDKVREILSGDWICSSVKIARELGFDDYTPFRLACEKTTRWYQEKGWI